MFTSWLLPHAEHLFDGTGASIVTKLDDHRIVLAINTRAERPTPDPLENVSFAGAIVAQSLPPDCAFQPVLDQLRKL